MDYSLLMGVHNIDLEMSAEEEQGNTSAAAEDSRMSLTAKSEAWKALQLDFNTTKGPSEYVQYMFSKSRLYVYLFKFINNIFAVFLNDNFIKNFRRLKFSEWIFTFF